MAEFDNEKYIGSYKIFNQKISTYKDINKSKIYNIRKMFFPDEAHLLQEPEEEIIDLEEEGRKEHNIRVNLYFHQYPDYNYFKKFRLEDEFEEQTFGDKFNTDRLRRVMFNDKDKTNKLLSAIKKRIADNSNIIIIIHGSPNSGKSEVAQTLAKVIIDTFYRLKRKKVKSHIVFSDPEFSLIVKDIKEGDVIIRDETPDVSGLGTINLKKNLGNLTKAIRQRQNSFIFVSPVELKSNIPVLHIETAGKYKKERMCRGILRNKDDYLGHIYVPLHNDDEIRAPYLKKKRENIDSLLDNAGFVGVEINAERFDNDINKLYQHCKKRGTLYKSELPGEIVKFNSTVDDSEKIKGDISYIGMVISNTWGDIKKAKNKGIFHIYNVEEEKEIKEEKVEINNKYDIPDIKENDMPFYDYVFKVLKGVSATIGRDLSKGKTYEQINRDNNDISEWTVSQIAKELREGKGKNMRLGYLFEDYYALIKLGVDKEFLREIVAHNDNVPDIIWDNKIYSCKLRINNKDKTLSFSQSENCRPEYMEAIKRESTYYFVFFNPCWGKEILIEEIDPINNSDKIVCTPGLIRVENIKKNPES